MEDLGITLAKEVAYVESWVKTILTIFFDHGDTIRLEFVSKDTIVNHHFYREVLERLTYTSRRIRQDLWEAKRWMSHPRHRVRAHYHQRQAVLGREVGCSILYPRPCSQRLLLFPRMKKSSTEPTSGRSSTSRTCPVHPENVRVTSVLKDLKTEAFDDCFHK